MIKKTVCFGLVIFTVLQGSASVAAVEIYGQAHVTVDMLADGEDSGANVSSNSSRIGFRSDAELAEGLKGKLQFEQEVRLDNGSGTFVTRDSYLGLEGAFGGVRLGFFNTPLKTIRSRVDFFNDQIGDVRNLTRLNQMVVVPEAGTTPEVTADFDTRFRNGIHYYTPDFDGLRFDLHYSTNNSTNANPPDDTHSAYSGSVTYNVGDLYVAVAYEQQQTTNDSNALRIGVKYVLGDLIFAGLYQKAIVRPDAAPDETVDTAGFGARYKITDNTAVKSHYYVLTAETDNSNAGMFAIGFDHDLSKQFSVLAAYATTDNDDNVNYGMSAAGRGDKLTPLMGERADGFSAGLRYNFN